MSPVSSRISRTIHSVAVSPKSIFPPGISHLKSARGISLSLRKESNTFPEVSKITPKTEITILLLFCSSTIFIPQLLRLRLRDTNLWPLVYHKESNPHPVSHQLFHHPSYRKRKDIKQNKY